MPNNSKFSFRKNRPQNLRIDISEIKIAIENMENDKSPGIDGIPAEFYKEFYTILKKDLQDIFNKVLFNLKTTPKTRNQAIITLIPKQTEKLDELKYWRPISLLCSDYKILTKILSNRLKQIMPEIISLEQNCSVPQRTIFNNLFLIRDLIKYTTEKNNKFYLLQIDQEKAFDKIDRRFPFKTMEKLGLSKTFIKFIEIIYKQNTSMIINNGFLSESIPMSRGLRQGCPLSLPLYVIQSEITTQNINKDTNILGLAIPNQKEQLKLSQYADDSNFFLKNENSVKNVITYFQKLQKATGSTINYEKTTVLPINTMESTNLPKEIKIKQRYQTVKILGIQNWTNIIQKITNQTKKLSQRILSLKGKVQIVNTMILSKTSFLSNVFPIDLQTTLSIQE